MYKPLQDSEVKKLVFNIKISSILIQLTYLAFPLSMFIVYNKVIANNNPTAILIVVLFLLVIVLVQFALKTIEIMQKNIVRTDGLIKDHIDYINTKLDESGANQDSLLKINELSTIAKKNHQDIQDQVSKSYLNFLVIYFILIIIVGGPIVIIPLVFLGLNFIVAKNLTEKFETAENSYLELNNQRIIFLKEMLSKNKEIKSLNIISEIANKHDNLITSANRFKCLSLYYKDMLLKVSQIFNMVTIAFILIFGRYLYSLGYIKIEEIIACTLLTVWISRSIGQIFLTLSLFLLHRSNKIQNPSNDSTSRIDFNKDFFEIKSNSITQEQISKIAQEFENHPIVYFRQTDNISLRKLKDTYKKSYLNIAYIDNNFKLLYGSIIDNVTLFNSTKYDEARKLLNGFGVQQLIDNLPYQVNYVLTGSDDDAIPYDLLLAIVFVRELLKSPDLVIVDINSDEISLNIKKSLISYIKEHNIKLIIKQNTFDLNKTRHENIH